MTKKRGLNESHIKEFSRQAKNYSRYNIIQKEVAKKLISNINTQPKKILDLGCGQGAIYELIKWKITKFTAIDKAQQMCTLHPKDKKVSLIQADFENNKILETIGTYDIVISSSALQWAKDIDKLFKNISKITKKIAFAIFCDGTFKTIYNITSLNSFLPSYKELIKNLDKYFNFTHEIVEYKLYFDNNLSKFQYIKKSGVSGGENRLSYKETKNLIKNYPLDYLEFEVLFIWGEVKH